VPRGLLVVLVLTACSAPFRTTVTLTKDELERRLSARFPIEKRALIAAVQLDHPRVLFERGTDRIGFELDATASVLDETRAGKASVLGRLRYDPASGQFFLIEPELVSFEIPDLPEEHREPIRQAASLVLEATLPAIPVHQIDDASKRAFIKSVKVQDQTVRVELGI
jgi:hypothetical protein